ncbi:MAG: ROK family protein [Anaerolineales bacterium]|nr:ROK family protein [Anaerolineales bacterium]
MTELILALDFGGTKHTAGLAARGEHTWRGRRQMFSPPGADADLDLAAMLSMGQALLSGQQPAAVGVSFGGPVEYSTGVVRLSHHVPGWENKPLRRIIADAFGAPAFVDNDANLGAIGEHRFGAGQGYDSLLYITVSTGVGGGWVLNGRPWRGHDSMAGEFGHTVVDPNGPPCVCGGRGCVERLAAGPMIARRAREWLSAEPERDTALRRLVKHDLAAIDAQAVAQAAARGDEMAWEALAASARALGQAIGNAANLVNPQRFVLGGGVTKSGARYWDAIRASARSAAMPEVHFDIVPAHLGDDAPLWGAVALVEIETGA